MEDLIKPQYPAMTEARATLLSKVLGLVSEALNVAICELKQWIENDALTLKFILVSP